DPHCVSIWVYCCQSCTSRNVPIRSNSSTATNSASGAQSAGPVMVGTNRCMTCVYSITLRVNGPWWPSSSVMARASRSGLAGAAGQQVREVFGRQDAGRGRAHVRDVVDQPVRVERTYVRREVVERHRERHADIERGVAVHADPP